MDELVKRGEAIAREQQWLKLQTLAQQLRAMFGGAAVDVEEARVLVRGRGLIKRWLIDPQLRFLGGGLK
ncbi:MAG: hypothetical protein ACJ8FS_02395 [Sphingomicrobium sp.]